MKKFFSHQGHIDIKPLLNQAKHGDAKAQFALGWTYQNGRSVPQNDFQAVQWYQKSAEQGYVKAQYNLGKMYNEGHGVPKDSTQALHWFRKAAEQGHAGAQCDLGAIYENGRGIPKDYVLAVRWFRKSAENGYAEAQYNLGYLYENGHGVSKNYAMAVQWYREASEQGHAEAQCYLGEMYENGYGVTKDETQAAYWYKKAAEQGHAEAQHNLESLTFKNITNPVEKQYPTLHFPQHTHGKLTLEQFEDKNNYQTSLPDETTVAPKNDDLKPVGCMTTAELLAVLTQEYPNGVSFTPMALRLIRQKVPFEDCQIESLKIAMFQIEDGRWFSHKMIVDAHSLVVLEKQATAWLNEYGCFSIERLFEDYRGVLRHIATPGACALFLRHIGFHVTTRRTVGNFCILPSLDLDGALKAIAEMIAEWIENADGILACYEIEQAMPNLDIEALEDIRLQFLPEVHKAEIGEILCWRTAEAVILPEDFSEKLISIVDTLTILNLPVSDKNLEFALNLFYRTRFREEYGLQDTKTFVRVCYEHYEKSGKTQIFRVGRKYYTHISRKRVRSPNTLFRNLGVPVGAELVFTKDNHVTCIALDDSNQVEHLGKAWTISALANHLLNIPYANGFCFFCYEGETLWDRRLRLEREGKQNESQVTEMSQSTEIQSTDVEIIGLSGQVISASTWCAFRRDGSSPRVAEWARRVANGESVEQVAQASGYAVSTMKNMILNHHLYFKVCKLNGIVPEGGTDV